MKNHIVFEAYRNFYAALRIEILTQRFRQAAVVYLFASSGALTLYNKWLWVSWDFKYPILTTSIHLLTSGIVGACLQVCKMESKEVRNGILSGLALRRYGCVCCACLAFMCDCSPFFSVIVSTDDPAPVSVRRILLRARHSMAVGAPGRIVRAHHLR